MTDAATVAAAWRDLDDQERADLNAFLAGWFARSDPGAFGLAVTTWKASR